MKALDQRREIAKRRQTLHGANAQCSPFEIANRRDRLACVPDGLQGSFRLVEQNSSGVGQPDLTCAPDEQFGVKFFLEQPDRIKSGLHNVHPLCGAGEVLLLGHRHEMLQLPNIHDIQPAD